MDSEELLEQVAFRLLQRWFDLYTVNGQEVITVEEATYCVIAVSITDDERREIGELFRSLLAHDAKMRGIPRMYKRVHKRVFMQILAARPERKADQQGQQAHHLSQEFDAVAPSLAQLIGRQVRSRIVDCRKAHQLITGNSFDESIGEKGLLAQFSRRKKSEEVEEQIAEQILEQLAAEKRENQQLL